MDRDLARLMNSRRKCRCCGATFSQLMSLEYDRPDPCPPDLPKLDNSALLMERGDILTEDFCRVDDYRFVRSVLIMTLGDGPHEMILGVWCAVSSDHFDAYVDLFDGQETSDLGTIPAWMSSAVPPESEIPVACALHMQPGDHRPEVEITERGHELRMLQETGLDLMGVLQILHDYGHDLASLVHDS